MDEIESKQKEMFEKLSHIDVGDKTDKKNGLTYLSWAWAWQEFKKVCPDATYEIKKFTNSNGEQTFYFEDGDFGVMVWTSVTANGLTYDMWLPVMDSANKPMKRTEYENKGKTIAPCSMFDINKTIMRCLVKNIAMFGLGLYIYAGEDLPEEQKKPCTSEQIARIKELCDIEKLLACYGLKSLEDFDNKTAQSIIDKKEKQLAKQKALTTPPETVSL